LLVAALLAVGWLLVSFRAVRLEADAQVLLDRAQERRPTPTELREARRDLDRAGQLSADTAPLMLEAQLLEATHDRVGAAKIATRLTKEEPQNANGWFLAYFTAGPNKARAKQALHELGQLNPWATDGLR
jgi:hypothetical protein